MIKLYEENGVIKIHKFFDKENKAIPCDWIDCGYMGSCKNCPFKDYDELLTEKETLRLLNEKNIH